MRLRPVPPIVDFSGLKPLSGPALDIDDGGTATMTLVEFRGRAAVLKRYRESASPAALTKLISWPRKLSLTDRAALRRMAAWPQALVYDGERLVGLLVPLAPARFIEAGKPRSLDRLPDDERVKLTAFGHLIGAVTWLHDRGVVVNDLAPPNILVAGDGDGVHLVDCDSMLGEHWERVLSHNAAPEDLQDLVDVDNPTTATDFARLAHVIICGLFDAEVVDIDDHHSELVRMVGQETATFLCAARRMNLGDDADAIWRLLGDRWLGGDPGDDRLIGEPPLYDESDMPGLDGWMLDGGLQEVAYRPPIRWSARVSLAAAAATLLLIGVLAGMSLR